jgi:hypothetical protein
MKKQILTLVFIALNSAFIVAQTLFYLKADRLFDGDVVHEKWGVLVRDRKIESVGSQANMENALPPNCTTIDFGDATLLKKHGLCAWRERRFMPKEH